MPLRGVLGGVGLTGLLLVVAQLVPPALGVETEPTRPSIAPALVWVGLWLVVPFLAALIGNWYTDLNPWRALASLIGIGKQEQPQLLTRAGVEPAALLLFAFTWLELVSPRSGDPVTLGVAALVYTVFLMVVMASFGRETGLAVFDFFTPYVRLISAVSPFGRDRSGRIRWRGWLRALPILPEWRGLWVFVVVMIGTVSYDGASAAAWFTGLVGSLGDTIQGRGFLLLASVLVVGAAYWLACAAAARLGGSAFSPSVVAQRFAHTLVPIALAYAFAHYFTLVIFEGQQILAAVSDPFALGWDLFGTAERKVDFFITATEPIWYVQVASIVGGHVLGVVLAHDRALADFGQDAVRSQYAMLALMVALTSMGLFILAG